MRLSVLYPAATDFFMIHAQGGLECDPHPCHNTQPPAMPFKVLGRSPSWSHFTVQACRSLWWWPKALEPTLVGMKFLLITLPDLLSQPAVLWVTQVAVSHELFWAVMLICRMEKMRRPVSERLRADAALWDHQWKITTLRGTSEP